MGKIDIKTEGYSIKSPEELASESKSEEVLPVEEVAPPEDITFKEKRPNNFFAFLAVVIIFIGVFIGAFFFYNSKISKNPSTSTTPSGNTSKDKIIKFASDSDFVNYLKKAKESSQSSFAGSSSFSSTSKSISVPSIGSAQGMAPLSNVGTTDTSSLDRVSESNVQTLGIDEPDIVKTDGKNIYLSQDFGSILPLLNRSSVGAVGISAPIVDKYMPPTYVTKTSLIKAFPVSDLNEVSKIDNSGNLLLSGNYLLIFSGDKITGYDVSNPLNPTKVWNYDYDSNNSFVSARLYGGSVYLITKSYVNDFTPCPIPMFKGQNQFSIPCSDIYHPTTIIPADSTYNVLKLNPSDGKIEAKTSFLATSSQTITYMSDKNIYITYTRYINTIDFIYGFFNEKGKDLVSAEFLQKLNNLRTLDISDAAKMTELSVILQDYSSSLTSDETLKFQNDIANRMQDYLDIHSRDLEKTGIVKVSVDSLSFSADAAVPGHPLNQFSLDEFGGYLRIATTVGGNVFGNSAKMVNDLYVLDSKMNLVGQLQDLGKGEKIYSARFIGNIAYLVTFKQTDPFFVIDLTKPTSPIVKGELQIPGYSSYLHPLSDKLILGIGKDQNQVKASLFDTSDLTNPKEVSKYQLTEYWSDVLNNHLAFLQDSKHKIFFLPGGNGAYIFSYDNSNLNLVKAVQTPNAKRAIFINDNLYVISQNKIEVLDENTWEVVKTLDLSG